MFRWFFASESSIPAELGFSLYGTAHISALLMICAVTVSGAFFYRASNDARKNKIRKSMAWMLVVLELIKEFVMALVGTYGIGYLPLHLCSLSMFLCLYYAYHPDSKVCGRLLYSVCLPGALSALLFPDWTAFPIWHFQSLHSFLFHMLLVQCALFPLVSGEFHPSLRSVWEGQIFLVSCAIPIGVLNHLLRTNYMFLNRASAGSPLVFLSKLPGGQTGYLTGYFLLASCILVAENLPFSIYYRIKSKTDASGAQSSAVKRVKK